MGAMHINSNEFESVVINEKQPVLVDFYADWCGPCKMMGPIVDQLADMVQGKAKVVKINVDDNPDLAQKYNVMTIPNFVAFKDGEPSGSVVGVQSQSVLQKMIGIF